MRTKIIGELDDLVKEGVITSDVADRVVQHYKNKSLQAPNRLVTIFAILGALLIGAGIVLLIAHNWDNLSINIKTVTAFVPLVIGQLLVVYSVLKNKNKTWREASGTFLCFAVASCISLVSQVYHLPGEVSSFLLIWISLSIPLVYILQSQVISILMILGATYYAMEVGYWNYRSYETPWMFFVFIAIVLPFYWARLRTTIRSNATVFLNWLFPLCIALALGTFIYKNEDLGFIMYISFFGMCFALGKLPVFKHLKSVGNGFMVIGSLGLVVTLMMCTYKWPWKEFGMNWSFFSQEFCIALLFGLLAILFSTYSVVKEGWKSLTAFHISFLIFWMLFFLFSSREILPIAVTNVLVFILGLSTVIRAVRSHDFRMLNYGLIIISIVIVCRFFDTNLSFVIRGILFVMVGVGFFLANFWMLKKVSKINQPDKNKMRLKILEK